MKISEIKAKSIIIKSNLPDSDYVINPYIGCMHGCIYCYAKFMKRFTNHDEEWGKFVDVKINAPDLIKNNKKYKNKSITLSSVTDPYQPIERKYELTRKILKKLINLQPELCVMTKSDLIVRDINVLREFKNCVVGFSVSTLNDEIRKEIEPLASPVEKRIEALKKLKEEGLSTFLFISPMLPELTNFEEIIRKTKNIVDEFWFENLNITPTNWYNIKKWLKNNHVSLLKEYERIYFTKNIYWDSIEREIKGCCSKNKIKFKIYFHH